ncbi:hypothetical protein L6164_000700 [Bauhinia variegata]|uniref:Uncharacterized protein n=1 Tax=Bauhinia variegata TaxID=167791 RepID=A0ACB9Q6L8_BAUVA|nr:hypothetical protein L6164_000700 [Bauhinia variegata]
MERERERMDFGGNMFCLGNVSREQNGGSNNVNFAWDSWEPTSNSVNSRLVNAFYTTTAATAAETTGPATRQEASLENALMFLPQANHKDCAHPQQQQQQTLYSAAEGSHVHPDPHLMCLKLGKRHYFEDANAPHAGGNGGGGGGLPLAGKRGKAYYGSGGSGGGGGSGVLKTASFANAAVPKCQVEGCHVALLNAKDYHRRHKVCEMHSKAPKVVVLGLEQRFCQQCSRFHVISEFDDSKRSCRRRLAGHNERRRKSSHESVARNTFQGCVRSLLSSKNDSWLSPADLSSRCSAALRELMAENRAAIMARQLNSDRDWHLHHSTAMEELKEPIQLHESNYFPQHMFPYNWHAN